jgi:Protein of unknown function (DUF760)
VNNGSNLSNTFSGGNSEPEVLLQYVQSLSPEAIAKLSRPDSSEVMQVMEHNIIGLLGGLPHDGFDVSITTSREDLGRLLASAMMSGYFLRNVEQRFSFENSLARNAADS